MAETAGVKPRLVWDAPTRLFHWLLVLSIIASWVTGDLLKDQMQLHLWLGYWTAGLIIFRLLWLVMGSRHARLWGFLRGPVTTLRYAGSMFGKSHVEAAGHNAMGGWMVVVLLALVFTQVLTGLFATSDVFSGPWARTTVVSPDVKKALGGWHEINFNLILAAVGLHVLAIAVYQFGLKHDLVGPMFTGRKAAARVTEQDAIKGTPWIRFVVAVVVSAAAAWALVVYAPVPPPEPAKAADDPSLMEVFDDF